GACPRLPPRRADAARLPRQPEPRLRRHVRRPVWRPPRPDRATRLRRLRRAGQPLAPGEAADCREGTALRAVVIGGGLAGLAAALELASRRVDVTLLEARPTLGGAVQTLPERDGDPDPPPDNGQHIALGCCTGYLAFLDRIGESGSYRRTPLVLPVVGEDGAVATIAPTPGALLRYRHVPVADRLRIPLVTARCRGVRPRAGETFGALLRRLGASDAAVERFWDVFLRPALNLKVDEADASAGLFTVRTALLGGRRASDLVLPTRPLGEMHGAAAGRTLERAGATVRTGARVVQLDDLATDCCKVV